MKPEDGVAAYGLGLPSSFILHSWASDREFWRRVIDQFIVPPDAHGPTGPSENQLWWFHVVDIVLTAGTALRKRRPDPRGDECVSEVHGSLSCKGEWHRETATIDDDGKH